MVAFEQCGGWYQGADESPAEGPVPAAKGLGVLAHGGEGQLTNELIGAVVEGSGPQPRDGDGGAARSVVSASPAIRPEASVPERPEVAPPREENGPSAHPDLSVGATGVAGAVPTSALASLLTGGNVAVVTDWHQVAAVGPSGRCGARMRFVKLIARLLLIPLDLEPHGPGVRCGVGVKVGACLTDGPGHIVRLKPAQLVCLGDVRTSDLEALTEGLHNGERPWPLTGGWDICEARRVVEELLVHVFTWDALSAFAGDNGVVALDDALAVLDVLVAVARAIGQGQGHHGCNCRDDRGDDANLDPRGVLHLDPEGLVAGLIVLAVSWLGHGGPFRRLVRYDPPNAHGVTSGTIPLDPGPESDCAFGYRGRRTTGTPSISPTAPNLLPSATNLQRHSPPRRSSPFCARLPSSAVVLALRTRGTSSRTSPELAWHPVGDGRGAVWKDLPL